MKTFKVLLMLLAITAVTSTARIFAAWNVMSIVNKSVSGFNGSYSTAWYTIPTAQGGQHHRLKNINVSRELDVRVEKDDGIKGSWQIMKNDKVTNLTSNGSVYNLYMYGGKFKLYIDSRITYINSTKITKADWYVAYP